MFPRRAGAAGSFVEKAKITLTANLFTKAWTAKKKKNTAVNIRWRNLNIL